MWMLIISAFIFGFSLGGVTGVMAGGIRIIHNISKRGFVEVNGELYYVKSLDSKKLKEDLEKEYGRAD